MEEDETVYTPQSQLRSPGRLIRSMWQDLLASHELAWRLTVRDIAARYRRSLLGIFWAILPPVATAVVFVFLRRGGIIDIAEPKVPYPVYVMVGTVLWQLFTVSLNAPLKVISANIALFSKVNFPREALVLSAVGQVIFDMGIKLLILVGVLAFFRVPVSWETLWCLPAMVVLMVLGITIGLLLVPTGLLYSDVTAGLPVVISLWFFVTPVVYSPPTSWPYSLVTWLNPVSPPLLAARDLVTRGTLDNPLAYLIVTGATFLVLLLSWLLYRLALPIMVERMPA